LTDYCHPCQVLADLQTIREYHKGFDGKKLCFIGDGNNMANSLIVGGLKTGMNVHIACPKAYQPPKDILEFAAAYGDKFMMTESPAEAAKGADAVYTDVWASMGQESEKAKRERDFAGYQVNSEIMALTNPGCIVLHCLPAHRGEEITEEVFEAHANEIFDEAENRLHAQKAVLVMVMGD
ncbi:MAG: ornithine carbamoyltransferase, partial [Clostridia bacterium]|nr:ornithine carbamoyltransferase [Clostridia bacterium]